MSLNLSLMDRRALLRDAERDSNPQDTSLLDKALAGASEEERATLAKTLPPTRWFNAEGATLRASYALVALGKPKLVADTLAKVPSLDVDSIKLAARGRTDEWLLAYCHAAAEAFSVLGADILGISVELQAERSLFCDAPTYMDRLPNWLGQDISRDRTDVTKDAQSILMRMRQHGGFGMRAFWEFFRVEGLGASYLLTDWAPQAWNHVIVTLCATEPGFRERLLHDSLGALLNDFSAKNILWYLRVHRLIDPQPHEILDRETAYLAVLATAPSTAVGLAQDMLARVVKHASFDADALIEASAGVLARSEKKLVKAQLELLADLAASAEREERLKNILPPALETMPIELAALARKRFLFLGADLDKAQAPVAMTASGAVVPVTVRAPVPVLSALSVRDSTPEPIRSQDEMWGLVAEHLEGAGNGADLPRVMAYWAEHPQLSLPSELAHRASEVIETVWDASGAAPRRLLATVLLAQQPAVFKGYGTHVVVQKGEPDPEGAEMRDSSGNMSSFDPATGDYQVVETWTVRSGYQFQKTRAPMALLAQQFRDLFEARSKGLPSPFLNAIKAQNFVWERHITPPGEGRYSRDLEVLGDGAKAFWLTAAGTLVPGEWAALDVSEVAREFTFRAQEAREQDGYDQLLQWTAWMLRDNPDTLAAHFHPMLYAAMAVLNVRGMAALMAALGASRRALNGPGYSALALAASAKMPEHRAQAAEAVAQLAASGLLNPQSFAHEVSAHLADDFVMAGRVAQTLSDAASISAIAGFRVLKTLECLLPALHGADGKPLTQAGKLVELAARLSSEYGTPLAVPESLAARSKGASAQAVSIRALQAITPHNTELLRQAAVEAEAALPIET